MSKFKSRGVACGNWIEVGGTEVCSASAESSTLRVFLKAAKVEGYVIISIDVSTAFLTAPLNLPYMVLVEPPKVFVEAGVVEPGELWHALRAIYGFREAPKAWGDHRDGELRKMVLLTERQVCMCSAGAWQAQVFG